MREVESCEEAHAEWGFPKRFDVISWVNLSISDLE